jgi:hypothetical protein
MTFEHALVDGDLDLQLAILDELAERPDTGEHYYIARAPSISPNTTFELAIPRG